MPNDLRTLSRDLRRTKEALALATNDTTRKVAQRIFSEAIRLSSGTRTAKDQRSADHPYAKRHGAPAWPLVPINVGTGLFRQSWRLDNLTGEGGIVRRTLNNDSAVGEYLQFGTPTMFARPLASYLDETARREWDRLAPDAYERALRTAIAR